MLVYIESASAVTSWAPGGRSSIAAMASVRCHELEMNASVLHPSGWSWTSIHLPNPCSRLQLTATIGLVLVQGCLWILSVM
jgi:hypothetical protein